MPKGRVFVLVWFAGILTSMVGLIGCASNVQPAVSQFGADVVSAQNAETAYIFALNQQQLEANTVQMLGSPTLQPIDDTHNLVRGYGATADAPTYAVPPDAAAAINSLLKPIQAYGQAMQALSASTVAATLDANTINLAQQAATLSSASLGPIKLAGWPSAAQLGDVAKAINDVGNQIIAYKISQDIQTAARNTQPSLQEIIITLKQINAIWDQQVSANESRDIANGAVLIWNSQKTLPPSYDERVALLAIINDEETPLTSVEADNALEAIVKANAAIAAAGPEAAQTDLENLEKAISDADTAYKAFSKH